MTKEELKAELTKAYNDGMRDGVTSFAWWRDGIQYVGNCGTTLADALASMIVPEKKK